MLVVAEQNIVLMIFDGLMAIRIEQLNQLFTQQKNQTTNKVQDMKCCMGSFNTAGFSSQIESGNLPNETHIAYEGLFNEIKFDVGKKTHLPKDIHFGYARYQFSESPHDNQVNDYLALFLKSNKDGADRDQRGLNSIICLDISGSMGGGLQGGKLSGKFRSRLSLSVQAIKMFISKLRPSDSVGVITFNNSAQIIIEPMLKSQLPADVFDRLDQITVQGGTTIRSGFQLSLALLSGWITAHGKQGSQNRIVMLTDVGDNSISNQKAFIQAASNTTNINLTIIGISDQFKSQVCECLKDVKGFNYFCAVNQDDIKKYVFQLFDFVYFPSAYDTNITLKCKDILSFEVFGAPDSDKVLQYNNQFMADTNDFTITKVKSTFPSEISIVNDKVYTFGGLILLKLKRKSNQPFFKGTIKLNYSDVYGKQYQQQYSLNYEFPPFQQYFSQQSLKQAIQAFTFAYEMKCILKQASKLNDLGQCFDRYWPALTALQSIIPKSKQSDLKNIKNILKQSKEKGEQPKFEKNAFGW